MTKLKFQHTVMIRFETCIALTATLLEPRKCTITIYTQSGDVTVNAMAVSLSIIILIMFSLSWFRLASSTCTPSSRFIILACLSCLTIRVFFTSVIRNVGMPYITVYTKLFLKSVDCSTTQSSVLLPVHGDE